MGKFQPARNPRHQVAHSLSTQLSHRQCVVSREALAVELLLKAKEQAGSGAFTPQPPCLRPSNTDSHSPAIPRLTSLASNPSAESLSGPPGYLGRGYPTAQGCSSIE
jgi:hypothetical protein